MRVCVLTSSIRLAPACATPQSGGAGEGFEVTKYGDGRVALIGFPSGEWAGWAG